MVKKCKPCMFGGRGTYLEPFDGWPESDEKPIPGYPADIWAPR